MNANELQQELRVQARHLRKRSTPLNHIVPLMQRSADFIQQQQAEILAGKIMIKGYSKTIDEQQAAIETLKEKLDEAIDAEKDRRFE